jgi:transposase-like protein
VKTKNIAALGQAEKKKAILEEVKASSDSVKATLKELGLGQSTYYRWLKGYKAGGVDGLKTGGAVSDKVWKRFKARREKEEEQSEGEKKLKAEEKQVMKSDKDKEKMRKILFKQFGEEPSKPAKKKEGTPPGPPKPKAPDKPSSPSHTPPPADPMDKMLKYAMGAFAFVVAILIMASLSNSNNFYFKQKDQMIEMWQGRFAPMGKGMVASFSDPAIIEGLPEQGSYTKKQAYGALCAYFIKQADDMLNAGDIPDLKGAKAYLRQASKYAVSDAARSAIRERLKSINRVRDNLQEYVEPPKQG